MKSIKFLFFCLIFISSLSLGQKPHCLSSMNNDLLLTAFYYPSNTIMSPGALNVFKESVRHLDILNYSTSSYGIMDKDNQYVLADIAKQNLITINQWLKKNHLQTKLYLSLGHWAAKMHEVFTHDEARSKFIASIIQILKDNNYQISGIDIDWENFFSPRPAEIKAFPLFVQQLREALNKNHLQNICLSLDLPVYPVFAKKYPTPQKWLADVDWVNIMAYEFYGDAAHTELDGALGTVIAPYAGHEPRYKTFSIASSLDYYTNEAHIPKNKIVVAVPFYGNMNYIHEADKNHQNGLHQKVIDDRPFITMDFASIYNDFGVYAAPKKQVTIYQYTFSEPTQVKGTHAYWGIKLITESPQVGKSYKFVSYPDPLAIKEITQFIKKEGYLGLSAWQLDFDLPFSHPHALLKTMYTSIHGK